MLKFLASQLYFNNQISWNRPSLKESLSVTLASIFSLSLLPLMNYSANILKKCFSSQAAIKENREIGARLFFFNRSDETKKFFFHKKLMEVEWATISVGGDLKNTTYLLLLALALSFQPYTHTHTRTRTHKHTRTLSLLSSFPFPAADVRHCLYFSLSMQGSQLISCLHLSHWIFLPLLKHSDPQKTGFIQEVVLKLLKSYQ